MAETAIVSFHTLPVGFPLPTISKNSLYTLFCSLILCDGEVIVQGDEGPVCGVAQGVDCHGVTVGHEEKEEEKVEQEVESDGEKTLKERCAYLS